MLGSGMDCQEQITEQITEQIRGRINEISEKLHKSLITRLPAGRQGL